MGLMMAHPRVWPRSCEHARMGEAMLLCCGKTAEGNALAEAACTAAACTCN